VCRRRMSRLHKPLAAMQNESNTPGQSVRRRPTDQIRPVLLHDSRQSLAIALMLTLLLPTAFGQTVRVLVERVGQWPDQGGVAGFGVAVVGSYAYLASGTNGLHVVDVSDPTRPRRVGGYDTKGKAWRVAVSGQYAYVADDTAGLQIIDVSDPVNPQQVGGYDTRGSALGVAVSGSYAYVADGISGLQVIDVSDPVNPQLVGWQGTFGLAVNVAVRDPYVYVAVGHGLLQVFDVSNPARPWPVGEFWGDGTGWFESVVLSGEYVYAANWIFGLQIFRIRPASPRMDRPLRLSAEGFQVWLYAPVVGTYRLEFSEDLQFWESLTTLSNVIGRVEFWDRSATGAVQRFYRAVQIR